MIDLIELDLIKHVPALKLSIITSGQVIAEITDEKQIEIVNGLIADRIIKVDFDGSVIDIQSLFELFRGLSFADCSVLELAIRRKGQILTSDSGIRNSAIKKNIPVKGILWIIEQLVYQNAITLEDGLASLTLYPKINTWAPKKEIAALKIKLTSFPITHT